MRQIAFASMLMRLATSDANSAYKVLFDACNDLIADTSFGQLDFYLNAPEFGINPGEIEKISNESIKATRNAEQTKALNNSVQRDTLQKADF